MSEKQSIKNELVAVLPALRGFAGSLTRNADAANDLVQATLLKAWTHQSQFTPGTNIRAWTFTIMRNEYLSQWRKTKFEDLTSESYRFSKLAEKPGQLESLSFAEVRRALDLLNAEQREAIILCGASGFSYEEAAEICKVPIGTIKSRVNRARTHLAALLPDIQSYEPETTGRSAMASTMP